MVSSEYLDGGDSCEGCNPPPPEPPGGDDDDDSQEQAISPKQAEQQAAGIDALGDYSDFWDYSYEEYGGHYTGTVGDPVRIATGSFTVSETDISFRCGNIAVEITRIYQSDRARAHFFGQGWFFNYQSRIIRGVKPNAEMIVEEMEELYERADYPSIRKKLRKAEEEASLALHNKSRNVYVLNNTDPDYLHLTGNGTLTLIDENGAPVLYTLAQSPIYGASNPYPSGSACHSNVHSYDRLRMLSGGSYILVKRDMTKYRYSPYGLLTSITDRNGNQVSFLYSGGKLVQIQASDGRTISLHWSGSRIARILDPMGREVGYSYDSSGRLSSRTDQQGNIVRYVYSGNRITGIIKPDGSRRSYFYSGRNGKQVVGHTVDEEGRAETFHYYSGYTEYRNPSGIVERHYYNSNNLTTRIDYSDGSFEKKGYDGFNNLINFTDRGGYTFRYFYDSRGNKVREVDPFGSEETRAYNSLNLVTRYVDKKGQKTEYQYDGKGNLLTRTYPDGSRVTCEYNAAGQVTKLTDEEAHITLYTYVDYGYVSSIKDAEGHLHQFKRDRMGNRLAYTDPVGNVTRYEYDRLDRLIRVSDPAGNEETYKYNNRNDLIEKADKNGRSTRFVYNKRHELIKIINPLGEETEFNYRGDGKLIDWIIGGTYRTRYVYDPVGNLAEKELANVDAVWRYHNNPLGHLQTVIDPEGHVFEYDYDFQGRLVSAKNPDGTFYSYEYDKNGNLITKRDEAGNITEWSYDSRNRALHKVDAQGNRTEYKYNGVGKLSQLTNALGHTTRFRYDALNRLISETDPLGNASVIAYDPRGLVVSVRNRGGFETRLSYNNLSLLEQVENPQGGMRRVNYSPTGKVASVIDELGYETTFEYDSLDRLVRKKDAEGNATQYEFDALGNISRMIDPLGNTTKYEFDQLGGLAKETDPLGNSKRYEYDKVGNLVSVTDELAHSTRYDYDWAGRLTRITNPMGETIHYSYDKRGNRSGEQIGNGEIHQYEYDSLNRLSYEINRLRNKQSYTYDAVGKLITKRDFNGDKIHYAYDQLNRLIRVEFPDGGFKEFDWDPDGNLISARNQDVTDMFSYDQLNRLVEVHHSIRDYNREDKVLRYSYDHLNNQIARSIGIGGRERKAQFKYDRTGKLLELIDPESEITAFQYDAAGNLVKRLYPNHTGSEYRYDSSGRLESLIHYEKKRYSQKNVLSSFGYVHDQVGRIAYKVEGDGGVTAYVYDPASRLKEVYYPYESGKREDAYLERMEVALITSTGRSRRTADSGSALDLRSAEKRERLRNRLSLEHAESGTQRTWFAESFPLSSSERVKIENTYDEIKINNRKSGRATILANRFWKEKYKHDGASNIIERQDAWGDVPFAYDAANRLVKLGNISYEYDANGNLVREVNGKETKRYEYNAENRLVGVYIKSSDRYKREQPLVKYKYDGLGRKVVCERYSFGDRATYEIEDYLYDGLSFNPLLSSVKKLKTVSKFYTVKEYYYRDRNPLIVKELEGTGHFSRNRLKSSTYFYSDIIGTTAFATKNSDLSRPVSEHFDSDVYGRFFKGDLSFAHNIGFSGKIRDAEADLSYFGFRHYSPVRKQWITVDPIRDGPNWYAYCAADPVNYVDPLGLCASDKVVSGRVLAEVADNFGFDGPPGYGITRTPTYEEILHKSNQQALSFASIATSAILGSSGPPTLSPGTVRALSSIAANPAVVVAVSAITSFMRSKSKGDAGKYPPDEEEWVAETKDVSHEMLEAKRAYERYENLKKSSEAQNLGEAVEAIGANSGFNRAVHAVKEFFRNLF